MPVLKTGHIMVYHCLSVRPFYMLRSNLRTCWPIHFKFHRVIRIDGVIWLSGFREDFLEINQSETRIVCGGHAC
jgi:hypothetical protein